MPAPSATSKARASARPSTASRKTTATRSAAAQPRRAPVRKPIRAATRPALAARPFSHEFEGAFDQSPASAQRLVVDRLTGGTRTDAERLGDTAELVHWASAPARQAQRRALIAACAQGKSEIVLIHEVSTLPADQVDDFVRDYFEAGGAVAPVMQWLRMAGTVLRRRRTRSAPPRRAAAQRASRGFNPFKAIGDALDKIGSAGAQALDALGNAVGALADAVIKAGKSLAQMVSEAASWTLGELTDLVESLLRAGQKVADILAAAAAKSLDQLRRYVQALVAAGRSAAEIVAWAVGQAVAVADAAVSQLLALGSKILDLAKAVLARGRDALVAVLRGVLAAGRKLADVLAAIASEALAVVQPVVDALLALGRSLRELLVESAKLAAAACRTILTALLNLQRTLQQILVEAIAAAGTTLRVIVGALDALSYGVARLLAAVAREAAGVVKALVGVLIAMGKKLAVIVLEAVSQGAAVVKAALGALLALGYKVVDLLFTVAGRALSAVRTVLEGLLAMGVSLGSLVADICIGIAEGFRRGFFEGLVAIGKAPLQILKAAFEFKASLALLAFAVLMEMFGGYRALERDERREAEVIFGSSIDLDRVQLGFAKLPFDVIDYVNVEIPRAFTTMYLLNFGPGATVDMRTVIHELTHVWQGVQSGPLYMTRALEAQIGAGVTSLFHTGHYDDSAAYDVTDDELRDHAGDFAKFNPEEQAQIVENFWRATRDGATTTQPVELLRPYAVQVFKPIRARTAARKRPVANGTARRATARARA